MQTYTIRVTIVLAEGQRFSRTGQYYNCADAFSAATYAFPEARYIGCINLGVTA
jgi:hypothetical protein